MSVRAYKPILPAHSALWWRRRDLSFGLWRRALWSRALGRALRVGVLRSYGCRARGFPGDDPTGTNPLHSRFLDCVILERVVLDLGWSILSSTGTVLRRSAR